MGRMLAGLMMLCAVAWGYLARWSDLPLSHNLSLSTMPNFSLLPSREEKESIPPPSNLSHPAVTSLCEIAMAPESFNNRRVQFSAYLDFGEGWSQMRAEACPRSPVNLVLAPEASKAKALLADAYNRRPVGTDYKDIQARFVGRILWNGNDEDHRTQFRFVVEDVHDLTITTRTEKRPSPFPELR